MKCSACPVKCGADRTIRAGACGVKGLTVAKYYLHPYEEPCLAPNGKSGAVFFSGCNLRCVFCQNFEVSRARRGKEVTPEGLAEIFRGLEKQGAENIDLVTPDHLVDGIAEALALARPKVPVLFNSGGYCSPAALRRIDPYIDVYLPDFKFFSPDLAKRWTGREDYFSVAAEAISFMAQKPVRFEGEKLCSGLVVRHLVLPGGSGDSLRLLDALQKIAPHAVLSLLRQYTPTGDIADFPELQRKITAREYRRVADHAAALGFPLVYTQGKESADLSFVPEWDF